MVISLARGTRGTGNTPLCNRTAHATTLSLKPFKVNKGCSTRAEANFPRISEAKHGTPPLFFPRATRAVENVSRFAFRGVINDAQAKVGVAWTTKSYSKLACKLLLRRIEKVERLKEVA